MGVCQSKSNQVVVPNRKKSPLFVGTVSLSNLSSEDNDIISEEEMAMPGAISNGSSEDYDVISEEEMALPAAEEVATDYAKDSSDAVGLKEMNKVMKADGTLCETVVRMETPIGIPIEEVYDGVHDGVVLGSGISGIVRLVKHKATGIEYAVKAIDLGLIKDAESLKQLRNEISIMCQVDHPNIVRLEEVYESEREIYLVQELCSGGDLFDRLDEQPDYHYTENQCARLVRQMLSSLRYLHGKKIIHRDLKLENFLFSSRKADSELKLIDFGLSKHFQFGEIQHETVGTPYTVAPEVIKGSYIERSDVWAIGVITYLLCSGETPFGGCDGEDLGQVRNNILSGSFFFEPPDVWDTVSECAQDFIRRLLVVDYQKRPSAKHALRHQWIDNVIEHDERFGCSMHGNGLNPNVVKALVSFKEYSDMRKLLLEILSFTLLPEQIMSLKSDFVKLDVDGDGEISLADFKQMLVQNAEAGCLGALTNTEVEQIFDAMRVRKSETAIHYHEFLAASLSQCKVDERNLRLAFNRLDAERKGYITFDNIMEMVGSNTNGNRDALQKTWAQSIRKECKADVEQICYEDFVLLMKGQTKKEGDDAQFKRICEGHNQVFRDTDDSSTITNERIRQTLSVDDAEHVTRNAFVPPRTCSMDHSICHTMRIAAKEDGEKNTQHLLLRANTTRALLIPGRGGKRKVDRVIRDETKSPLVVNKTLYRANREMRLAVLEASMQFEEKQAQRATRTNIFMRRKSHPTEQEFLTLARKRSDAQRRSRARSDLTGMVLDPSL